MTRSVAKGTTTIRVRRDVKDRLAVLQQKWKERRGEDISQQDLVAKAVEHVDRHLAEFIDEQGWRPWTNEQIDALYEAVVTDFGFDTSSEDIDDVVYGDP